MIKVIPQAFLTPIGIRRSYALIKDNVPIRVFDSKEELTKFLEVLDGTS